MIFFKVKHFPCTCRHMHLYVWFLCLMHPIVRGCSQVTLLLRKILHVNLNNSEQYNIYQFTGYDWSMFIVLQDNHCPALCFRKCQLVYILKGNKHSIVQKVSEWIIYIQQKYICWWCSFLLMNNYKLSDLILIPKTTKNFQNWTQGNQMLPIKSFYWPTTNSHQIPSLASALYCYVIFLQ